MKKLKFDYIKIGSHKRPIIPVRLTYENQSVNTPALIDSGADLVIFKKGNNINFSTPIVFTDDIPSNGMPLLGEAGFFDHLKEVSFYYQRGKVILEDKS